MEKRQDKESRHKLTSIAEGTFKVKSVDTDSKTIIIIRSDNSVENVTRYRLFLAPDEPTANDLLQATRWMTIAEIFSDFSASEADKMTKISLHKPTPTPEPEKSQRPPGITDESPKVDKKDAGSAEFQPTSSEINSHIEAIAEEDSNVEEKPNTEEFVMDKIVNDRINRSRNHAYAQYGDILYRTRWYG